MILLRRLLVLSMLLPTVCSADLHTVIVEGLPGDDVYAEQFARQVEAIEASSSSLTDANKTRVFRTAAATRDAVLAHFETLQTQLESDDQLAVFLIGHGSYDDVEYKFNIAGPDLTGEDLVSAFDDIAATTQLLVNTSSSSGAIAELLAADQRVLVLATKSGMERHATRFGNFFATALAEPAADLDKNDIISVEEAFQYAERQVTDYFDRNNQLATEHPRLHGDRADRISLARLGERRAAVADNVLAELVAERDVLNADIDALRLRRDDMPLAEYQPLLLEKMVELAQLEDAIEAREKALQDDD